jgi:hypothetical protein
MLAGFALICGCGGVVVVLLLAASLLRLSISLTNKLLGRAPAPTRSSGGIAAWDWDDWDDEFSPPARKRSGSRGQVGAVPEPGIPKCGAIMLLTVVAFGLGFLVMGLAGEALIGLRMWPDDEKLLLAILNLPVADLALTTLLIVMLPTTFWRAAMVTFVYNLILLAFTLVLVAGTAVFVGVID